jgi:hypothetical protein
MWWKGRGNSGKDNRRKQKDNSFINLKPSFGNEYVLSKDNSGVNILFKVNIFFKGVIGIRVLSKLSVFQLWYMFRSLLGG